MTRPRTGIVRVGVSGWNYPSWRGVFYPNGLPHTRELAFASRAVRTIELNATFYSLERPSRFKHWASESPEGFVFALKGSRFITHIRRLRDCKTALANFFASGLLALEQKLGPILWQLPPTLRFEADRLRGFLSLLPRTTYDAVHLTRHHDGRLEAARTFLEARVDRPIRHAIEVRHPSYDAPGFFELLNEGQVALCIADSPGQYPRLFGVTADFVYVRLHGSKELYASGYTEAELDAWAERINVWRKSGRDVFVYFNNDACAHAPFNAMSLAKRCA